MTSSTGYGSTGRLARLRGRIVRRVRRRALGFVNTAQPMRRGTGTTLAVCFFAGGLAYGSTVSGVWRDWASFGAASVGLRTGDVAITGAIETQPAEVWSALELDTRPSLVGLDMDAARLRVENLPWVRSAVLRATLSGRLDIRLEERAAFAVWQEGERMTIVDREGSIVTEYGISEIISDRFGGLPRIIGEGAPEHAAEILPIAARHGRLVSRIVAYERVGDRRWDVVFDSGLRARLPEEGLDQALSRFASLELEADLLARPLLVADMRQDDRVTLRLAEEAVKAHAERAKATLKAMKALDRASGKRKL